MPADRKSIIGTAFLAFPLGKDLSTFFPIYIEKFNTSIGYPYINFLINKLVIKTNFCRIFLGTGVIHRLWPRPINCAEAHGAGFAGSVNSTTFQLERV